MKLENKIEFIKFDNPLFSAVKDIRVKVFTNEQGALADEEFDEYDKSADFALLYEDDKPVATARIAVTSKGFKIGRIAVLKECRGKKYGAKIVNAVTKNAFEQGAVSVLVDAQNYAVPFYEKLGFRVIGSEIVDRGLPHIPMSIDKGDFYGKER